MAFSFSVNHDPLGEKDLAIFDHQTTAPGNMPLLKLHSHGPSNGFHLDRLYNAKPARPGKESPRKDWRWPATAATMVRDRKKY